jgi:hypothetical protein
MTTEVGDSAVGLNEVGETQGGNVTGTDLLKELHSIQDTFTWYLTRQGRIRANLKNDSARRVFDPVTAVAYFRSGEFYPEGNWTQAAKTMGLMFADCAEIVAASNYEWDPKCRQGALRNNLLGILLPRNNPTEHSRLSSSFADLVFRGLRKRSASTTH